MQPKERGQERDGEMSKANEVKDSQDCRGKEWGDKNKEYFEDSNPPLSVQLQCEPCMQSQIFQQPPLKKSKETGECNFDDTTLMAKSEEELKSQLMKLKEESEKNGLKLSIHYN